MEDREILVGMSRGVDFDHDDVVAARTHLFSLRGGQSCASPTGEITEIRQVTTTTLISIVSWEIPRSKIQIPDTLKQFLEWNTFIEIGIRFLNQIPDFAK